MISIRSLTRSFGAAKVLRGVDVDIAAGETVALVGANGSGKTTLLEILATVLLPTAGAATVNGFDLVTDAAAVRRLIGYAPAQLQSFYPRLTGEQNLRFFAALHGLHGPGARARVAGLLEQVELTAAGRMRVERYSDGMKARLNLARALLHDPLVLLLDEPTRSIDRDFRARVPGLLAARAAGPSRTVLWVTHDREEAGAADRVVVLADGRARLDERPRLVRAVS